MTVKVVIGHAAWAGDARRLNYEKLARDLSPDYVHVSKGQEHAAVWCRDLWEWTARQSEPVVILNDDVEVCPRFRDVTLAMARASGESLALHTTFPALVDAKGPAWYRSYWYTGPAVLLRPSWAAYLLAFWDGHPELHDANEDMVGIYGAYEAKRPYWHPVPAPVKHRADIRSTLGYDGHLYRVTNVAWDHPRFQEIDLANETTWTFSPPRLEVPWMRDATLRQNRKC